MGTIQKIAIFFDSFTLGGGAERLVLELARLFKADVFTSGYDKRLYNEWAGNARVFDIGNFFGKVSPRLGFVESALRFAFFKPKQKYDLFIFSGFFSVFAAWRLKPNIWYCCQPNRTIYDLKEFQESQSGFFGKLLIKAYAFFWKPLDQWIVKKHIEKIVCISETVRKRVKKFFGVESITIFPPITAKECHFEEFGDFFFFAGRLIPEKRVGLLLEAFSEMPEKKLVIAGTGPLGKEITRFSERFGNISFRARVSEKELHSLFANCLATIYLPIQEDFGMFPLEGNAAGKACIAAKEGGCLETIIDGKNGFLIKPEKRELKKAIRSFSKKKAVAMKPHCLARAGAFDEKRFFVAWKKLLKQPMQKKSGMMPEKRITEKDYDERTKRKTSEQWIKEYFDPAEEHKAKRLNEIVEALGIKKNEKILDVGCGLGPFVFHAGKEGAKCIGADYSGETLKMGKKIFEKIASGSSRGVFARANAFELPFKNACFDKLLNADFLEHVYAEEKKAVISEMFRVLKPEGIVVSYTPNKKRLRFDYWLKKILLAMRGKRLGWQKGDAKTILFDTELHVGLCKAKELKELFEKNGFKVKKTSFIGYSLPLASRILPGLRIMQDTFGAYILMVAEKN